MEKKPLKALYDVLLSTHIGAIEDEAGTNTLHWMSALGARIAIIDALVRHPDVQKYFFPSERKRLLKKVMKAKRLFMIVRFTKGNGALSNNTKRKLCRVRSLIAMFQV